MRRALACLGLLALLAPVPAVADAAADAAADRAIRAALERWTVDFNAGRADRVCALFSPELRYDYRGFQERGFEEICDLLKRSLADRTRRFSYRPPLVKEVIVAGDLGVVRLVWTLTVRPVGSSEVFVSREPGMDVFRRQPDGGWTIVRYIAYEE